MHSHIGLTSHDVLSLRRQYGLNKLPEEKKRTRLHHLLSQFNSPLIYILVIAGVITYLLHDAQDAVIIFVAVCVNTLLGYYQEVKAENALNALKNMLSPQAKVMRNGALTTIPVEELVPGDIVLLSQGDKVPADAQLIEAVQLAMNEALLTGESTAVRKDLKDTVYMGSYVMYGRGMCEVKKTGISTKMGKIAQEISTIDTTVTPLQKRLDNLARSLALLVLALSGIIMLIGLIKGVPFSDIFSTSVALAVAAVPEGMTIALTVILALGMQRILKKKALVRRLVAAETLGSVTVIATDKTGTLTEGLMRVTKTDIIDMKTAVQVVTYANNLDDPLEFALWQWVQDAQYDPQALSDEVVRQAEKPFDSDTKYMSVTVQGMTYIKGAPEIVLEKTNLSPLAKKKHLEMITQWSNQGLRLIGLCTQKGNQEWKWIGLVGMEDPVRKDISSVMETCAQAGIRTMMITGDYEGTARAVWSKVQPHGIDFQVLDGMQLEKMSDRDLSEAVKTVDIYARVSPSQKLRIVRAMQQSGEIVALVGDGVNDAPALKEANIGIVVGSASDVAKETADMVLLDSNFKTIVSAIEEGRGLYSNIRKVVRYLMSGAFGEVVLVVGSIMLDLPMPITAAQILWINIITDGLPALALTAEPKHPHLLKRKPIDSALPILDSEMKWLIGLVSGLTGLSCLALFAYYLPFEGLHTARTITFSALSVTSLLYIFSLRSLTRPIFDPTRRWNYALFAAVGVGIMLQIGSVANIHLRSFLQNESISIFHWITIVSFACGLLFFLELLKSVFGRLYIHHR